MKLSLWSPFKTAYLSTASPNNYVNKLCVILSVSELGCMAHHILQARLRRSTCSLQRRKPPTLTLALQCAADGPIPLLAGWSGRVSKHRSPTTRALWSLSRPPWLPSTDFRPRSGHTRRPYTAHRHTVSWQVDRHSYPAASVLTCGHIACTSHRNGPPKLYIDDTSWLKVVGLRLSSRLSLISPRPSTCRLHTLPSSSRSVDADAEAVVCGPPVVVSK